MTGHQIIIVLHLGHGAGVSLRPRIQRRDSALEVIIILFLLNVVV